MEYREFYTVVTRVYRMEGCKSFKGKEELFGTRDFGKKDYAGDKREERRKRAIVLLSEGCLNCVPGDSPRRGSLNIDV